MNEDKTALDVEKCLTDGPQSALEKNLIIEYLRGKGFTLKDLERMPKEEASLLMTEACTYASLKLAEVESRANFREEIRAP